MDDTNDDDDQWWQNQTRSGPPPLRRKFLRSNLASHANAFSTTAAGKFNIFFCNPTQIKPKFLLHSQALLFFCNFKYPRSCTSMHQTKPTNRKMAATHSQISPASALPCVVLLLLLLLSPSTAWQYPNLQSQFQWPQTKSEAVDRACSSTLYPGECKSSLMAFEDLAEKPGPIDIMCASLNLSLNAVHRTDTVAKFLEKHFKISDKRVLSALLDCVELFGDTLDQIKSTLGDLRNTSFLHLPRHDADLRALLSAAITNQYTCIEGFAHTGHSFRQRLFAGFVNITHLVSNSLAMVKKASDDASAVLAQISGRRKLLQTKEDEFSRSYAKIVDGFPAWISAGDRKLLQAPAGGITPNAVVAQDGSGNFRTVTDAVEAAPNKTKSRYVIRIKAGTYKENVDVGKKKTNLMFIGDGIDKTIITGSKSFGGGSTTFRSATVAVTGMGFVARDLTIENTAGPSNHQAVALRSGADHSAFYRCSIKAYQDTLYAHSLRQFYRECDIYGTVDFIFGNAAAVLQDCNLYGRKPNPKQHVIYTAQGRQDPNENTGLSIQNCRLTATSDLKAAISEFKVYLGRPWKAYSRTVFLQNFMADVIDPRGFLEWNGTFALDTLYYGEYDNRGPGSGTADRVNWTGYHVITDAAVARQFTVTNFIEGDAWLPATGVQFTAGLN